MTVSLTKAVPVNLVKQLLPEARPSARRRTFVRGVQIIAALPTDLKRQRTKAEVLVERRAMLAAELEKLDQQIASLKRLDCGIRCSCGKLLQTEWDFADHFIVPNERYLNLGNCPVADGELASRYL
jgi:hypothetical protein